MLNLFRQHKLIIFIFFLGFLLRFFMLGKHPISLNLDEVAIGYNAFSILKTGHDEYGASFPIAFRSHDDYKAPLYIYLTTLPVAILGLNAVSVRIVSAIAGSIAVLFTYLLVKELIGTEKKWKGLPELTSFLLAISPWHIQFSRAAFETNLSSLLLIIGLWSFLKARKKAWYWFISAVSVGLSLYAYHSAKVFVPMIGAYLLFLFRDRAWSKKYTAILSASLFFIIVLPVLLFSFSPEGQLRFKGTNIFSTPTGLYENRLQRVEVYNKGKPIQARLFHNDPLSGSIVILKNYLKHFDFGFLFFETGMPKSHTPNVGLLYLWELPFLLLGVYWMYEQKFTYRGLVGIWLLLTPVASALTWDTPSSTRTNIVHPMLPIIVAIGLLMFFRKINKKYLKIAKILITFTAIFFFFNYLHNYYVVAPSKFGSGWQVGYKELVDYSESELAGLESIVVSTRLKQPQNFFTFYSQYDPQKYLEIDGGTVSGGFDEQNNKFGRYQFKRIDWKQLVEGVGYIDYLSNKPEEIEPDLVVADFSSEPLFVYVN